MTIRIENLNKHFGNFHALQNINLTVPTGSLTALLGPSGCGKTTLLRIIAGLEHADSGAIFFDDENVTAKHVRERKVGFMFQHYALFRHMNVFDNIAFGLQILPRRERPSKAEIEEKVLTLLKLVQLEQLAKAYPDQLSGGQRQRIALARALATEPKLLLLDEPFGALDAKVRKELRHWLRQIHHELGITSILVTHDQEEALEMADEIVVMNHGVIEQVGSGDNLYHTPANVFVTEFLGEVNAFDDARIEQNHLYIGGYQEPLSGPSNERQNVTAYVRPHELAVFTRPKENSIGEAEIEAIQTTGPMVRLTLRQADSRKTLQALMPQSQYRAEPLEVSQTVWLYPQARTVFKLPQMVEYVI
ncbi:MAG: sulfate ABC transporter ATP-binding protein [Neisseria sp.]|uniref:sulfate/molybdate ABC transporter ATP-binding protein n=1 Tax=Neisseria sp. TaxID=192066 RepID=UPI0026DD622F|nr:sulfate ABC transporter ATP-binding protein [Neisseria sp.]MDO4640206.1 sulfate ABC transporter ATP-binding protein [Neisseria sp.]